MQAASARCQVLKGRLQASLLLLLYALHQHRLKGAEYRVVLVQGVEK